MEVDTKERSVRGGREGRIDKHTDQPSDRVGGRSVRCVLFALSENDLFERGSVCFSPIHYATGSLGGIGINTS